MKNKIPAVLLLTFVLTAVSCSYAPPGAPTAQESDITSSCQLGYGGCANVSNPVVPGSASSMDPETLSIQPGAGSLTVKHYAKKDLCDADYVSTSVTMNSNVITINENTGGDGPLSNCFCSYDFHTQINGLESGKKYVVKIYFEYKWSEFEVSVQ